MFSNVVVTSHSSCVFLYLFSSVNISPVRFVLHLRDRRSVVTANYRYSRTTI